jgi:hypothetical protein
MLGTDAINARNTALEHRVDRVLDLTNPAAGRSWRQPGR